MVTQPGWNEPRRGVAVLGVRLRTVTCTCSHCCVVLLRYSFQTSGSALLLRGSWLFSSSQAKSPFPHIHTRFLSDARVRHVPREARFPAAPGSPADFTLLTRHPSACLKLPPTSVSPPDVPGPRTGQCLSASQPHGAHRSS